MPEATGTVDRDSLRMRRQAVISRFAVLDNLGLPRCCVKAGKPKVSYPSRAAAESARDELNALDPDDGRKYPHPCGDHFHLTRNAGRATRSAPRPNVRVGDVVQVPGGIDRQLPAAHLMVVQHVGRRHLSGLVFTPSGQAILSREKRPRQCSMPLSLLPHCTVIDGSSLPSS